MSTRRSKQSGVALILVIFIVTLASILVVNLAYSTYLNSRVSAGAQRSIQAEYLLKSLLSFAQVLIDVGNPNMNSSKDLWAQFYDGIPIPPEYLGITQPNLKLSLEIRPADTGLCSKGLISSDGTGNKTWLTIFTVFFQKLGFDNDTDQTDESGLFPKKHFPAEALAASMIEYQDTDQKSYNVAGYESDLPKDSLKNTYITSYSELARIPGMTAHRLSLILPHITHNCNNEININFASGIKNLDTLVLTSLDPKITESTVQEIHNVALSDEPYNSGSDQRLQGLLTASTNNHVKFTTRSSYFNVIAEADYGTSHFFLRAVLLIDPNQGGVPKVHSFEIF